MTENYWAGDGVFVCVGRQSGEGGFNFVVTFSGGGQEGVLFLLRSHNSPSLHMCEIEANTTDDDKQNPVKICDD